MTIAVRFTPELGAWLNSGLSKGESESALVHTMMTQGMNGGVARAIVTAFVRARRSGTPAPHDSIVLEEGTLDYVDEAPRLAPGRRLVAGDRIVPVLLRLESPVLAVLGGVLAPGECAEVMRLARPRLAPSTVVDPTTGKDVVAPYRRSLGAFFRPNENAFIGSLERRIAALMNMPVENGEGFQILCYPEGGESEPHYDFLERSNDANRASIARSGQRVSTLITYLNDVASGGETFFPKLGVSVSPEPGNAVYFEYANGLDQVDRRSLHAGARVERGEKWVLTKWMRERPFVSAPAT